MAEDKGEGRYNTQYNKFETAFEIFQRQLKDEVAIALAEALKTLPRSASPVALDLDEFKEEMLAAMRAELQLFKDELLAETQNNQSPSQQAKPVQSQKIPPPYPVNGPKREQWRWMADWSGRYNKDGTPK